MKWVVAIEADRPDRKLKAHGTGGRMHAYDLLEEKLAHPLAVRHTVNADLMWGDAASGPRCQHCVEIAGAPDG